MENIYSLVLKDFFKVDKVFKNKSYLINANDDILFDKDDDRTTSSGIYFKLFLSKISNDLNIKLLLYSWCNDSQTYVPLEKSIWIEESFGDGKYINQIKNHYKKLIEDFLNMFKLINHYWQLKEIINKLENPTFIFHYKLLNTFSKEILENIVSKHFEIYPILNIPLLKSKIDKQDISYIFLPDYIQGFYIKGIEVSVDLDDSDFAIIEDDNGVITKDRFFEVI
uniref:hypothetical protein n=1 Tax=Aliarcobacter sp. TaxID=2321116 RepID=UPI004047A04B